MFALNYFFVFLFFLCFCMYQGWNHVWINK